MECMRQLARPPTALIVHAPRKLCEGKTRDAWRVEMTVANSLDQKIYKTKLFLKNPIKIVESYMKSGAVADASLYQRLQYQTVSPLLLDESIVSRRISTVREVQ